MQIPITGGTGFIGTALCRHLPGQGHKLTRLGRQRPDAVRRRCGGTVALKP